MPALRKKYSLTAQIAEVKREIALRRGEADMHIDLMLNVQETLEWLQTNEATVRAAVAKKLTT